MKYDENLRLTGTAWNNLDENKKVEVLQIIENHVAYETGRIACPVKSKFLYTGMGGVVLGVYDSKNRIIYVNSSQFDAESMYGKTSEALVTACLHEGRHAYQHQAVEGIILHGDTDEVEIWRENLKEGNYITFNENPKAYYNQPVETDARTYAEERYKELVSERESLEIKNSTDYKLAKERFEIQMNEKNIDNAKVKNSTVEKENAVVERYGQTGMHI